MLVISGVDGVNTAEDHRMDLLKARQRWRGVPRIGNRVTHFDFLRTFNIGGDVASFTYLQLFAHVRFRIEAANLFDLDFLSGVEQLDLHSRLELPVKNSHVGNDSFVSVEIRIENEGLERNGRGRFWRRDAFDNRFQNLIDAEAFLGAGKNGRVA